MPRVIRLLTYDRLPRQKVKFNRRNIFARDGNRCQYCGKRFATSELSLDHVVPRSRGGRATWENIVCACLKCNVRKGGRTPREAGMRLIREPVEPRTSPSLSAQALPPQVPELEDVPRQRLLVGRARVRRRTARPWAVPDSPSAGNVAASRRFRTKVVGNAFGDRVS